MRSALGALVLLFAASCAGCPPDWVERLPDEAGFVYGRASVGELGLPIGPEAVALSRAARAVAEQLGVEVASVSVVRLGDELTPLEGD